MVSTQKVFEIRIGRIEQLENKDLYGRLLRIEKYIHNFVVGHTQLLDSKLDRPNREKDQKGEIRPFILMKISGTRCKKVLLVPLLPNPKKFSVFQFFLPVRKPTLALAKFRFARSARRKYQ